MAVTGGGGGLVAGCRSPLARAKQGMDRLCPGHGEGQGRPNGIRDAALVSVVCCPDTKKENVCGRSLFLCVQAEDSTVFRERLQPSQLHVIFGDVPRCSLLCGSGGDHSSRPEKSFFRVGGERERGEGQFLQKTSLPPLVQKSVAETIRRRRRSRRRRRDWRRFRPGGPDGRPPACADGCPGDGCIRSRRCAPDGGRR